MAKLSEWNVLLDQFDGLVTDRDSDDIPDSKSPDLKNVRITGSHVRGALGYELAGSRNENAGEILSQWTFRKNNGAEVMVRVRDNGSAGVLEWFDATNEEWYQLLGSLTTGKKMGFAEFNTSSADQMIFCNGVENMSVWTGNTTRLTAALSGGETTINVASTAGFPSSGTIIYNGTEIAYSAKTATTFTVSSAHASAGANDGVAEAADDSTHSGVTKGNILLSAKDRLWIAGQPGDENALDYSDEGAAFTFTGGSNRSDSGSEGFFNIGGITGLAEKNEEIVVVGPHGGDGFSFTYPTATTKAPVFREIFRGYNKGCTSSGSVFKVENEVFFTNANGVVALGDLEGTEKVYSRSITREILPTLQAYNFDEAECTWFEKEKIALIACKTDPDFPGNNEVIGIEFYEKVVQGTRVQTYGLTRLDWPAASFAILADELYFGSSLEQNSFKGFSSYQNDGSPRSIRYATKRFHFSNPFQEKFAPYVGISGFIKPGTDVTVKILHNAGFGGETTKVIQSTGAYVSNNALNTIGAFKLGTNPIGSTLEAVSELKRFLVYLDLGVDINHNDVQLVFQSDTDGGTYLINHIGFILKERGYATRDDITI